MYYINNLWARQTKSQWTRWVSQSAATQCEASNPARQLLDFTLGQGTCFDYSHWTLTFRTCINSCQGGGVFFGLLPAGVWWVNIGSDGGWWSTVFSGLLGFRSSGEQSWRGDYLNPLSLLHPYQLDTSDSNKSSGTVGLRPLAGC